MKKKERENEFNMFLYTEEGSFKRLAWSNMQKRREEKRK